MMEIRIQELKRDTELCVGTIEDLQKTIDGALAEFKTKGNVKRKVKKSVDGAKRHRSNASV